MGASALWNAAAAAFRDVQQSTGIAVCEGWWYTGSGCLAGSGGWEGRFIQVIQVTAACSARVVKLQRKAQERAVLRAGARRAQLDICYSAK